MKRLTLTFIAAIIAAVSIAQNTAPASSPAIQTVTISSKGKDVRDVLSDLFDQTKKNFVIEPNIHFVLFLSLNDVEFEEALSLICKTAALKYQLQNGIYFITRDKSAVPASVVAGATVTRLPESVLKKTLTVKADHADLRELFSKMSALTGVPLRAGQGVPAYQVDVTLKGVTLKYALATICKAAGLTYRFANDATIEIVPAPNANHVTIHMDKQTP